MHPRAHALLGVGGPVFAIEAKKNGGVGNGHRGFEDENVELLAGLVDLVDDALVGHGFDLVVGEDVLDLFAVGGGPGSVVIGYEGEFGIHVDERADVDGAVDGSEDIAEDVEVRCVGLDGLDTGRRLERVGRVDDQNPVAMTEKGHCFVDARLPVRLGCESRDIVKEAHKGEDGDQEMATTMHRVGISCERKVKTQSNVRAGLVSGKT